MAQVDKKFPHFALEAYDPKSGQVKKVGKDDFAGRWLILFFYPADFTFVCPTELADMQKRSEEFLKLNAEILMVSTDTVYTHKAWLETEELLKNFSFIMAADHNGEFSKDLHIYNESNGMAGRAAFIIDPEGILRSAYIVADSIGRSSGEILRMLRAIKFSDEHPGKVCPASWDEGDRAIEKGIEHTGKVYKQFK